MMVNIMAISGYITFKDSREEHVRDFGTNTLV